MFHIFFFSTNNSLTGLSSHPPCGYATTSCRDCRFRFSVWVTSSFAKLRGVYSLSSPSRRFLQACVCFLGRPGPVRARLVHPRCGVLQADAFRPGWTQGLQSRSGRGQDAIRRGSYGTARVGPRRAKGLKRACAELECAESLIESDPS